MMAQKQGHLLAAKVEPAMWVMAQDRLKDDVLWISQGFKVTTPSPHGGPCIYKKVEARDERIAGTQFTRNDYALAVKWWCTAGDDPEERTYEAWVPTAADIEAYGMEQGDDVFVFWSTLLSFAW